MTYQATVIPVMIASPGDVEAERDIIRKVIARWNAVNAWSSKVVLEPVSWDTHMAPGVGRPQQRINDQLLPQCDLLIAVFWTRLGSPTGQAASGTMEEISAHLDAGKPAMIYFSVKPVAYDPNGRDQQDKVHEFKQSLQHKAHYQEYDEERAFEALLVRDLDITLQRDPYIKNLLQSPRSETIKEAVSAPQKEPAKSSAGPASAEASQTSLAMAFELTRDAIAVLVEAAQADGTISIRHYLSGTQIHSGKTLMAGDGSTAREVARWEEAIRELVSAGMVEHVNNDLFRVTHLGWQRGDAEVLALARSSGTGH